jgi:CBS domain-containing protein
VKALQHVKAAPQMVLGARTAADLMTPNPVSIRHSATIAEAAAFLTVRGISAAPVIDEAGRPLGVVSRSDILKQSQSVVHHAESAEHHQWVERAALSDDRAGDGAADRATDREVRLLPVFRIMTPAVFCVAPETPAAKVVEKMLVLEVRRLFVVDDNGILIGVISPADVLRKLRRWEPGGNGHPGG